jgi:uncharacterized paraquat-inducible protein A
MFCAACGNQLAPGLSFCNRCGYGQRERNSSQGTTMAALLAAITLIGLGGMGIMLGGMLVLKREAGLESDIIGLFMLFVFLIVSTIEFFLCRQLSRLATSEKKQQTLQPPIIQPNEIGAAQPRALHEPLTSVTDNTTRTLEYSQKESVRR